MEITSELEAKCDEIIAQYPQKRSAAMILMHLIQERFGYFDDSAIKFAAEKLRFLPGAILAAIMAASIGNVPLPQKGSTRILPPFQGVSMISDAARFSAMGAFAVSFRYPLLCRDSPVLSSPTVTSSFIRNTLTGKLAPSSGNQEI